MGRFFDENSAHLDQGVLVRASASHEVRICVCPGMVSTLRRIHAHGIPVSYHRVGYGSAMGQRLAARIYSPCIRT